MAARKLKRSEQLPETSGWELLVRLAQGGMGAVFLGTRRGTREPVYAIKRAHAHLLEETEFRKMFTAEAQLALKIQHPHAIGVRFVDETDGEPLLIMDYVEGGSFGELLTAAHDSGAKLPTGVVLRVVLDAARGLDAAHRIADERGQPLGIVHRDISPQNILVGTNGMSGIVDFGVAKAAAVEATRTATDVLKGKTAYMAPEYLKSRVANPQTDVFSLGVVAWEALANRRLFKREDEVGTMLAISGPEPAQMLVDLMPFDATLSAIIARALVKEPAQRFLTAREFADALEARAAAAELLATRGEVAAVIKRLLGEGLEERRALVEDALTQRFGMHEVSASARKTSRVPLATDSDASRPSDSRDSHPFQVMDTPRRRAFTAPQVRAHPRHTAPLPAAPTAILPAAVAAQVAASPPMFGQATVQLPPQAGYAMPARQPMPPVLPAAMPDLPATQGSFVAPAAISTPMPARGGSKLGWVIGGCVLTLAAAGVSAFGLLGAEKIGASPGDGASPGERASPSETATSVALAAPTALADLADSGPETAATSAEPSPDASATPASASETIVAPASETPPRPVRESAKAAPRPTTPGWRPKSNPYN